MAKKKMVLVQDVVTTQDEVATQREKKKRKKTIPTQDVVITQDDVIKWGINQLLGDKLSPVQRGLLENATIAVVSILQEVSKKR